MGVSTRSASKQVVSPPERFPPPQDGEIAWVVDAVTLAEDEGVQTFLASDPPDDVLDQVRLASVGLGLLSYLGRASFDTVTAEDISDVVLTEDQGRAWERASGLLPLLRSMVRGQSRGLRFVVCAGCHRWMVAKEVPKAKACPLTMGCGGPQVGVPAAVVTSVTPDQAGSR